LSQNFKRAGCAAGKPTLHFAGDLDSGSFFFACLLKQCYYNGTSLVHFIMRQHSNTYCRWLLWRAWFLYQYNNH